MLDKNVHIYDQKDELKTVISYKIKNCGLTFQQLAEQSNLSIPTIRNLANKKVLPSVMSLFKLSKGMGIDIAQLLYDETNN